MNFIRRGLQRGFRLANQAADPAAVSMLGLGFGSGLPYLLIGYTLSIWLRSVGWGLGAIGLISYLGLLYQFKFLWSAWLDIYRPVFFSSLGRRRGWLLLSQMTVAIGLLGIACAGTMLHTYALLAWVGLTAFAGATQDVMIDAFRIESGTESEQGRLVAINTLGYRFGLIAGGAVALYLSSLTGWRLAYAVMSGLMTLPMLATLMAREPETPAVPISSMPCRWAPVPAFQDFYQRYGGRLGLALLAFVGLFKLPEQLLAVIQGPFYLDCGFSPKDIATVSKLYGVWISIAGAFTGGLAISRWCMSRALWVAALALAMANLLYVLMSIAPHQFWAFLLTISGDNFSQGFAAAVLVAFMSSLTDRRYTATQYALLSSLAFLPGRLIGGISGYLVQAWGYSAFFILSALPIVPTLLLLIWSWPRLTASRRT